MFDFQNQSCTKLHKVFAELNFPEKDALIVLQKGTLRLETCTFPFRHQCNDCLPPAWVMKQVPSGITGNLEWCVRGRGRIKAKDYLETKE